MVLLIWHQGPENAKIVRYRRLSLWELTASSTFVGANRGHFQSALGGITGSGASARGRLYSAVRQFQRLGCCTIIITLYHCYLVLSLVVYLL